MSTKKEWLKFKEKIPTELFMEFPGVSLFWIFVFLIIKDTNPSLEDFKHLITDINGIDIFFISIGFLSLIMSTIGLIIIFFKLLISFISFLKSKF